MRLLPAALAISAAVHAAAIVWVESHPIKPQQVKLVAPSTVEIAEVVPKPAAEPEPMTVALLDDHSVAAAQHARGVGPRGKLAKQLSAAVSPAPETTLVPEVQKPPHTSLMTMRQPTIERGPSDAFTTRFLANSQPHPEPNTIETTEGHLGNQKWIDNASSDEVLAEREKLVAQRDAAENAELKPDGAGKKAEHQTFRVKVAPDGTVDIKDKRNWQQKSLFHAEFDVTDAMMRSHGIDPYASYKMKVLDETREQRVEMGKQYRTQQLAQSRQYMQKNLERLVASVTDPAALRQGLFELWDDCAETGSEELVTGGKAAREQLIGFVRAKLPPGSSDAFTVAELRRLNSHRRSRSEFAPYE